MGAMSIKDRLAAKRGTIAAGKAKGLRPYKWKGGKTKFRIVPSALGDNPECVFGERRMGKTYLKSFDGQSFFAIGDKDITYGQPDAIREMLFDAMRQAPDQETKDHYYKMIAKPRVVFSALILDDKDQSPTEPVLVEVSETAFDTILAQFEAYAEMDPDYDLAGQKTGHIFTCEKSGSGLDTSYVFLATPQKAPLKDEILEKAIDLDAWIQSQFEGLETKALEFLGRLNGAVGISVTPPAGLLGAPAGGGAAAPSTPAPATAPGVSAAAVTSLVEEDIVDAEIEEIPAEDSPFETAPETVAAAPAPAVAPTPAPAPAAAPVAAAPAPAAAAPAEDDEINDILAGLA